MFLTFFLDSPCCIGERLEVQQGGGPGCLGLDLAALLGFMSRLEIPFVVVF